MLTLHRRHKKSCPHTDRYIKLDAHRCPMWIEGMLDGVYRRESLKVSSWEKAEQIRREMEEGKGVRHLPISEAIETFLAEQKARALTESTLRKLRTLTASLSTFCQEKNIQTITQLDIGRVRQFRASWKDSPISMHVQIGTSDTYFGPRPFYLDLDKGQLRHGWLLGKSGTGKSSLLRNLIVEAIRNGCGIAVIGARALIALKSRNG